MLTPHTGPAHTHGPHISLVPRSHSHSGTRQGQSHGRCEDGVSPRLTCLAPAETQEKFLAPIVSLPPKLRSPSGLGIEDGGELRGSLGLGKVELAGSWVPPQTLHSLPCPRGVGSPLSPGEERKGYQSSTSQWLCGPRPAALLLSSVSSSGMAWGESLNSRACACTQAFAICRHVLGLSPAASQEGQDTSPQLIVLLATRAQGPCASSLPRHFSPFVPRVCVWRGQKGRTWMGLQDGVPGGAKGQEQLVRVPGFREVSVSWPTSSRTPGVFLRDPLNAWVCAAGSWGPSPCYTGRPEAFWWLSCQPRGWTGAQACRPA